MTVPVDLLDPRLHAEQDLRGVWRDLRRDEPVRWQPVDPALGAAVPGFWVVTRHTDVQRALRDTRTFSSQGGNMLATLLKGSDDGAGKMLVVTDGPRHLALRSLLMSGFGPRQLGPVTASIARSTRDLLAELVARGGGDFVAEVAAQVPLRAICELLGVPAADRARVLELTNGAMLGEHTEEASIEVRIARSEIMQYYLRLAARRREAPGSDVISLLVGGTVDGRPVTEEEVLFNCYNLIIGGDETARLSMAGGLLALAEHPAQWRRLLADAALVGPATEEILRWTTPVAHVGRRATVDTELGGQPIAAGDAVTLWCASANFDQEAFEEPDSFALSRDPNRHVTFGFGPHFCLGAQLARAEIQALLSELRAQAESFEVTGPVPRLASNFIRGVAALPMSFTPTRTV
ncbi:cytochrome P450 [Solihabitans fulvus]|uniref:Cytochrome P450 n=1 Tax=Solihabitans fulvus TaxID=1892852 RepID=A0A5B2WYB5_9PSEU|nr:cytochrome P450 [Solihabitans fulvus]KAA2256058.1 cytochrome P450 [Solihabitans fulvus]